MNGLVQHFMTLSNPEQIFDLEMTSFQNLPCHIFVKDPKGKYLSANHFTAHDAGFTQVSDILGLTDFDLPWSKEAFIVRQNDDKVKKQEKPLSFIEKGRIHTGKVCRYACLKAPFRGNSNKIIGIVGLSFFLEEIESPATFLPELSKQQFKCLYHLAQGMTMKEIAQALGLSPKTVEHYLSAAKTKLNCESRSALVAHAINAGLLQQ